MRLGGPVALSLEEVSCDCLRTRSVNPSPVPEGKELKPEQGDAFVVQIQQVLAHPFSVAVQDFPEERLDIQPVVCPLLS